MKVGAKRTCDVCGSEIPPRTTFRQVSLRREALRIFLHSDPDLQPTWQEKGDGSGQIQVDICLACNAGMGGSVKQAQDP
jgi:hypothetical protein